MKHFIICIITFTLVISYSIFIDIKGRAIFDSILLDTKSIVFESDIDSNTEIFENILNKYNDNKKTLQVLSNKEHLLKIDVLMNNLSIAFKNNDIIEMEKNTKEIQELILYLKSEIYSVV